MRISYNWLKWYIPQVPDPKELERVFTFHITEVEDVENINDDFVFNLKILPDRAGDLLSHLGVARELSGLLGLQYNDPVPQYKIPESIKTNLEIDIKTDKCSRYMGRIVKNVIVGPSPEWVVKHLASIGQRSINNIVDATNIVMFDCGHPVHAYDLQKLSSEKILVKELESDMDFPVVGKDEIVAKLKTGDIVVSDMDKCIALAGIKGGTNSGISVHESYTTDIVLEVANFNAVAVRKTGKRLSLNSDARKRFENNVPIELGTYAMVELSALIMEMCPNAIFEDIVDVYPVKQEERKVSFTTDIINERLGAKLTPADIAKILQNYHYDYLEENGNFIVHVPYWRSDINNISDMVEEIGRVYGYDKIVPVLPDFPLNHIQNETYFKIKKAKEFLLNEGYNEVMTYTFCKKGDVQVTRGLKGKDFLRKNLANGIKESFELNRLNAPLLGLKEIKIFEIGTVFSLEGEDTNVCTATKKGIEEMSLDVFITKNNVSFIPDLIWDTEISKKINRKFKMWSEYPFIVRDVSVWVPEDIALEKVEQVIKQIDSKYIVREGELFDQFTKDGKTSYAFRFVFQSYDKTLTDEEVNPVMEQMYGMLKKEGYEIR